MNDQEIQITPNRPEPIELIQEPEKVVKKSDRVTAAKNLMKGNDLLVTDRYSTGMAILAELKKQVFRGKKKSEFTAYRDSRSRFYRASNHLLVPIKGNKIALKKAPEPGWLEKLYPDKADFYLTFPQFQGLNSSWQWYLNGIKYPGLKEKIHPYFGTYFPTRFDHLQLFDNWVKKYPEPKTSAIDIGTGCGVLAFQMLNRGFETVYASDINPNALISAAEHARTLGLENRIHLMLSDLFETHNQKADLVVFNPPWLPADKDIEGLDSAIYYEPGLFERFFDQAGDFMNDEGRLVLLFSNLAESEGLSDLHPVKKELTEQQRFKKIRLLKRKVKQSSKKTKRRDHRKNEFVELWELEKIF
ncbi:MAG: class I SAM-dependent methyltransferase [Balneolaceae bacterium]|nr:class I SAM-dependent methyltransferase [Balneolaceae bacterium]